jgi:hypothetical protein
MNDPTTLTLAVDDQNARARFGAAVDALLATQREAPRLIVELDGTELPPALVAMFVGGLRRLREVGGAIAVEPRTPALRDAMALHGLDRVFALPLDPDTAARSRRRIRIPGAAALAFGDNT